MQEHEPSLHSAFAPHGLGRHFSLTAGGWSSKRLLLVFLKFDWKVCRKFSENMENIIAYELQLSDDI